MLPSPVQIMDSVLAWITGRTVARVDTVVGVTCMSPLLELRGAGCTAHTV